MSYSNTDLEKMLNHFGNPKQEAYDPSEDSILNTHFMFENVAVERRSGEATEFYEKLLVPKLPFHMDNWTINDSGTFSQNSLPHAQMKLQKENAFLPSSPLLAKIVTLMFDEAVSTDNGFKIKDMEKYSWVNIILNSDNHSLTNSIIDYSQKCVTHYPKKEYLKQHSFAHFQGEFNDGRTKWGSHFPPDRSTDIKLDSASMTQKDQSYLVSLFGNGTLSSIMKINQHFGNTYQVESNNYGSGSSSVILGKTCKTDCDIDDMQHFTYCIGAKKGDIL